MTNYCCPYSTTPKTPLGKFGVGFNSVYNCTDVPMLLSGRTFGILDPHSSQQFTDGLGRRGFLPGQARPGLQFDLFDYDTKKASGTRKKDFEGIEPLLAGFCPGYQWSKGFKVDFESMRKKQKDFQGTIFRLPLRTAEVAPLSKIKPIKYDEEKVLGLFSDFMSEIPEVICESHHLISFKQFLTTTLLASV
jgi:sacsin